MCKYYRFQRANFIFIHSYIFYGSAASPFGLLRDVICIVNTHILSKYAKMSTNSKKRSRKDKLVPRDCNFEGEQGNVLTQDEPYMKLVKIKAEPEWDDTIKSSSLPHMEFSVNVQVEEYHECHIKEEPEDTPDDVIDNNAVKPSGKLVKTPKTRLKPKSTTKNQVTETFKASVSEESNDVDLNDRLSYMKYKEYHINVADLATEPEHMTLADKLLYVEVRNILGQRPREPIAENKLDKMIEVAVNHTKIWYIMSKYGQYPVFYKCYVCSKAWWHLDDFRQHIQIHTSKDFKIHFEEDGQMFTASFNIIGYMKTVPEIKNIPLDGVCWQCCQDYNHHVLNNGVSASCVFCRNTYRSCRMQIKHQNSCQKAATAFKDQFFCSYCNITYYTKKDYDDHMRHYHSVRSDLISLTYCKVCFVCKEKYLQYSVHDCPSKKLKSQCMFCHRRFISGHLADIHARIAMPGNCPICQAEFPKSCMVTKHIAEKHTKNFQLAYKCILCTSFLVCISYHNLKLHMKKAHCIKFDKRRTGAALVILPKTCFDPNFVPSDGDSNEPDQAEQIQTMEDDQTIDSASQDGSEIEIVVPSKRSLLKTAFEQAINGTQGVEMVVFKTEIKQEPADLEENDIDSIPEHRISKAEFDNIISVIGDVKQEVEDQEVDDQEDVDQEVDDQEVDDQKGDDQEVDDQEVHGQVFDDDEEADGIDFDHIDDLISTKPNTGSLRRRKPKLYRCARCGYEDVHRQYRWHRDNNCKISKSDKYTCTMCEKSFNKMSRYLQHFSVHGVPHLSCPECFQKFKNSVKLSYHVNVHVKYNYIKLNLIDKFLSEKKYQCKKCVKYVENERFFAHWESHLKLDKVKVEDDKTNVASEGEDPMGSVTKLKPEIMRIMINRLQFTESSQRTLTRVCVVCSKRFERHHDVKRHIIEHLLSDAYATRPTNKMLVCQICGSGFDKAERFKYHMRIHGSMPLYKCELCDKSFSDSSNFTKHKKTHNLKVFTCDICAKKFLSKMSLEKHIELHKDVTPTACQSCEKVFYSPSEYRRHMLNRHTKQKLKFKCIVCKQRFDSLKLKWDHMWESHQERKYKADCHVCSKSFRKRQDLRMHMRRDHRLNVTNHYRKYSLNKDQKDNVSVMEVKIENVRSIVSEGHSAVAGSEVAESEAAESAVNSDGDVNASGITYSVIPEGTLRDLHMNGLETLVFFE